MKFNFAAVYATDLSSDEEKIFEVILESIVENTDKKED